MIHDMDYGTPAITCEAKPGICGIGGKCSKCDTAKAYMLKKYTYKIAELCKFKLVSGICIRDGGKECVVAECTYIAGEADKRLKMLKIIN